MRLLCVFDEQIAAGVLCVAVCALERGARCVSHADVIDEEVAHGRLQRTEGALKHRVRSGQVFSQALACVVLDIRAEGAREQGVLRAHVRHKQCVCCVLLHAVRALVSRRGGRLDSVAFQKVRVHGVSARTCRATRAAIAGRVQQRAHSSDVGRRVHERFEVVALLGKRQRRGRREDGNGSEEQDARLSRRRAYCANICEMLCYKAQHSGVIRFVWLQGQADGRIHGRRVKTVDNIPRKARRANSGHPSRGKGGGEGEMRSHTHTQRPKTCACPPAA